MGLRIAEVLFWCAKATGLPQNRRMITKNIGMLLLAIYLILIGIIALIHVAIPGIVTGIIALLAGILILIGR
jgi:membrane protein required for beta-lactamase induction